uniref:Transmembrane protein 220 n=1 Tax=Neolamprologus brichardi TaxID=32507 RepID=A0A3Q4H1A0_NEOBR
MGEVCKERKPWLRVVWQICNVFMCLFFGCDFNCFAFINFVSFSETLPWRRVADLHLLISSAISAMLGWTLYKEQITQIFQKEEGREFSGLVLTAFWLFLCRHSGRAPVGILRVSTAAAVTVFPFVAWLYYHINKDLRSDWPSHCTTAI